MILYPELPQRPFFVDVTQLRFFIPSVLIFLHSNLFLCVWPFVLISICLALSVATGP